jgi:ABC-type transporter Mla subunit MlaD
MADSPAYPGTPRWVKVFGIVVLVFALVVVVHMATGGGGRHGPGRHTSPAAAGQRP